MAGLLDFLNSAEAQTGLGLLAAAGPRSDGAGFGQRMLEGLSQGDRWKAQQAAAKRAAMQDQMAQMQMQQARAQLEQQQKMQGLAQQFARPEGFDYGGYANAMAGVDPMKAMEIQKSLAKQGPEYSTAPQYDQNGRAFILAKDGSMKYLDGVKARDKLEEVRLGDKVAFRSPYSTDMQGSMPIGQSADSRANNAVTMRGQNMTDARAREANSADGYSTKPLPTAALKMQNEAIDAIGTAGGINQMLSGVEKQIADKKVKFGPVSNLANQGLNAIGMSTEESRNFSSFKSDLEKIRNESLRLNSGVQTDGDAQRAWNELFQNINDTELVKQRLGEIKSINNRAVDLQKLKVDNIRGNYKAAPFDYGKLPDAGGASGDRASPTAGKKVVKTGMYGGRKVAQYEDGTTAYVD